MTVTTRIRAIAFDVDGVFTDGTFWFGPNGEEYKAACFLDVMGVSRARRSGVPMALISGEDTPFVRYLAQKLGITDVWMGCKDKVAALLEFGERHGLATAHLCFVGDDINDVSAMTLAGFAAAPATAHRSAIAAAALVTRSGGGRGAVREVLDYLAERDWVVDSSPAQ